MTETFLDVTDLLVWPRPRPRVLLGLQVLGSWCGALARRLPLGRHAASPQDGAPTRQVVTGH